MGNTANLALPYPVNTDPLANTAAAIQALANAIDAMHTSTWVAPTLTAGWTNFGGAYQTARYRKIGRAVHIQGLVKAPAGGAVSGAIIFTLPTGFRPPAQVLFAVTGTPGAVDAYSRVEVTSVGNVIVFTAQAASGALSINLPPFFTD